MTPEEFVEKVGWNDAKFYVNHYANDTQTAFKFLKVKEHTVQVNDGSIEYDFHIDDLSRLVESYNVVEKLGGIESALKAALRENERGHIINEGLILSSIRDVKACQ